MVSSGVLNLGYPTRYLSLVMEVLEFVVQPSSLSSCFCLVFAGFVHCFWYGLVLTL